MGALRFCALAVSLCSAALLAACGGGGGGGGSAALPPVAAPVTGSAQGVGAPGSSTVRQAVAFTISIPAAGTSSSRRHVAYVSPGTKSAVISYGGASQTVNCTQTCAATLQVMPGTQTFSVSLFAGDNGTGAMLSTGSAVATIVVGQSNVVNIVFGGVPAKLALVLGSATVTIGTAAVVPVTVQVQDAAGYTIVGADAYAQAIALSDDDTTGATSLSAASLAAPGAAVSLRYNGAALTAAHVTASVPGGSLVPAVATLNALAPAAAPAPAPVADGSVPAHIATWYYYGLAGTNLSIPASWMAAHADYVEDDGYDAGYAESFKDAGGKYAVAYTDPTFVPYCYAPFTAAAGGHCDGPIGNHVSSDESAWLHGADGQRIHRWDSNEYQYQEALNPASQSARDAYAWYTNRTISRAPKLDYFFLDDAGGLYTGSDGSALSQWFWGFNAAPVEITSDASFIPAYQQMMAAAARPVIINGYDTNSHLPAYNGLWAGSANVSGDAYEGCYSHAGGLAGDASGLWSGQANGLLMLAGRGSKALCMTNAASTPSNRIYLLASFWLTYVESASIMAPLTAPADGFTPLAEFDIVPRRPLATATSDIHALRSAGGAYVREFAACYQAGKPLGACAAVVNPGSGSVAMPALSGRYAGALTVDDKSAYGGGQAGWSGPVPAQLSPLSAVILR